MPHFKVGIHSRCGGQYLSRLMGEYIFGGRRYLMLALAVECVCTANPPSPPPSTDGGSTSVIQDQCGAHIRPAQHLIHNSACRLQLKARAKCSLFLPHNKVYRKQYLIQTEDIYKKMCFCIISKVLYTAIIYTHKQCFLFVCRTSRCVCTFHKRSCIKALMPS